MRYRLSSFLAIGALIAIAACDNTSPTMAPAVQSVSALSASLKAPPGYCVLANSETAKTGFDQYGYNRCAHIFNGVWSDYCTEPKRGADANCYGVLGSTKLNMKWNEEWDRYNFENGSNPPYDAWLDNEINGNYVGGAPFSEHFKVKWDLGCSQAPTSTADVNGYTYRLDGAKCIWGSFLVLMDQGKDGGEHVWWTKLSPAGYGN